MFLHVYCHSPFDKPFQEQQRLLELQSKVLFCEVLRLKGGGDGDIFNDDDDDDDEMMMLR